MNKDEYEDELRLKKKEIKSLKRRAADLSYMNLALRNMLGPYAQELVKTWDEKGVKRFHAFWGPGANELTGEERAKTILDFSNAKGEPIDRI